MLAELVAGERRAGWNVEVDGRAGPYSELIVNDVGFGRYFEAARNKRMFALGAVGFTVTANNLGALAAALQPIVGIYNPIGNTRAAVITKVRTQTRSGTPGGPFYIVGGLTSGDISTTPAGTIVDISLQGGVSSMQAYNATALTGYLAAGQAAYQLPAGGPAAIAAGAGQYGFDLETAGAYILPPGSIFAITASAAGTTHIVDADVVWAEIDWPL